MGYVSSIRAAAICALMVSTELFAFDYGYKSHCDVQDIQANFDLSADVGSSTNYMLSTWLTWAVQQETSRFKAELLKAPFPVRSVQMLKLQRWGDQGAIVESDDFNLVLFRGTQDALDVILDAAFFSVPGDRYALPGRVTFGFAAGFFALWPQVIDALMQIRAYEKPVIVAGHSLGGTYGAYAAYRLKRDGFDVRAVYGPASPVPGDADFAEAYNAELGSVTAISMYGADITPHVPPLVESGADFLAAIPKFMRSISATIMKRNRYTGVGRFFVHGTEEGSVVEVRDRKSAESRYWTSLAEMGTPLPILLLKDQRLITDHFVENYLCSINSK